MVPRERATQQPRDTRKTNLSKAISSLFPIKMIAKLEWTQSNVQQKIEQLHTPRLNKASCNKTCFQCLLHPVCLATETIENMKPKWQKLASLAQKICTLWFQFFGAVFASKGLPFKNIFILSNKLRILHECSCFIELVKRVEEKI